MKTCYFSHLLPEARAHVLEEYPELATNVKKLELEAMIVAREWADEQGDEFEEIDEIIDTCDAEW